MQGSREHGAPPLSPTTGRRRRAPRARDLILAGIALGALGLAACAPPATTVQSPTPTTAAPSTTAPPNIPTAPGGISAAPLLVNGLSQDFPDPFVRRVDDATACGGPASCYLAYSTQAFITAVPVIRSTDLATWDWAGPDDTKDAMPTQAPWVEFGTNWAPSVLDRPENAADQRYVMYYTATSTTTGTPCVGIATSASPVGPFVDTSSAPALCNPSAGGTMDADAYLDTNGDLYLTYADDDGIKAQRLSGDGLQLAGGEVTLLARATGYAWEQQRVEGPSMFRAPDGTLTLFYSAGVYTSASYAVGVLQCTTPLGPCTHAYSTPVLTSRGTMLGPGGQTPVQVSGDSWVLVFHAWDDVVGYPSGKRSLHELPMTFPVGRPKIG